MCKYRPYQTNTGYSIWNVCCALMCMSASGYISHCRSRVALLVCFVCCSFFLYTILYTPPSVWLEVFSVFLLFPWTWFYFLCLSYFTLYVLPLVPLHTHLHYISSPSSDSAASCLVCRGPSVWVWHHLQDSYCRSVWRVVRKRGWDHESGMHGHHLPCSAPLPAGDPVVQRR